MDQVLRVFALGSTGFPCLGPLSGLEGNFQRDDRPEAILSCQDG